MTTPAPKRAYTLTLEIGADTREELIAALRHIEFTTARGSNSCTSGGVGWGGWWDIAIQEEMTSERYHAECLAWLATLRSKPSE